MRKEKNLVTGSSEAAYIDRMDLCCGLSRPSGMSESEIPDVSRSLGGPGEYLGVPMSWHVSRGVVFIIIIPLCNRL
jgi:hypothetical protein